jgi:diguanylate cyclase (GGDEF)-like protein
MKAAHVVAERVRWEIEALSIPHEARPLPAVITISIGVAAASAEHARGADEVLKTADHALYRAKEHGRNRVVSI